MKRTLVAAVAIALAGPALAEVVKPSEVVVEDGMVKASLTGQPGDPAAGAKVFKNRKLGNCLACHQNPAMSDELFHGEIGPSLEGVGDRWSEEELRAILTDAKKVFPDTIMPAFYKDQGFNRPLEKFEGKSILSAQQVEDVIAYLKTLKE